MRVALCGRVEVRGPDGAVVVGRPQVQLCLAVLVLERHRAVTRDELAHALWGDDLGEHWRGALRGVLSRVREAFARAGLDGEVLQTSSHLVQLSLPATVEIDTEEARRLVNDAAHELRAGRVEAAVVGAAAAVTLLDGSFLVAVDRPWADARRQEVALQWRKALRLLARGLTTTDPAAAVGPLQRLLENDPYDEEAQELLVRCLVAAGERRAGLDAYRRHVRALHDELGVGPTPSLRQLGERLTAEPDHGETTRGDVAPSAGAEQSPGVAPAPGRGEPFVGREVELDLLGTELELCGSGGGAGVVVLEGEPGVGKTRLAREAAERFAESGGRVLWGRCSAHGELPFEPIGAALEGWLADGGGQQPELADLRIALGPVVLSLPDPSEGAPPDRGRLFAAVADAFRHITDRPVLWVVDDLQWATPDTLALLEHTALAVTDRPVLVVATCRERPPWVAEVLETVGRATSLRTVRLAGLGESAVQDWLVEADVHTPPGLAAEVRERTGGNPLFVTHLIRAAQDAGGELDPGALPPGLAALLAQRIDTLTRDEDLVLGAVAVAGELADLSLLSDITGLTARDLVRASERLVLSGLVVERGERLAFGHALVADVVLEHLGGARRSWLHLRAAAALEARPRRRGLAAELARHYACAGGDHAERARRWALVAADEALEQVAWAAASELAAVVLAEPAADPDERAGALVVLGRARRGMGDGAGADAALDEAVALARLHGLRRRFGESALALVGGGGRGIADPARHRWVPLIEEALAGLPDDGTEDRIRVPLLGALSVALLLTDRDDERRRVGAEALRSARRLGDRPLLARALLDHRYCLSPVQLEERLHEIDEALALAEAAHLPEVIAAGLVYRYEDLLVAGRRDEARVTMEQAEAHLARHPDAYWSWAVATWHVVERLLDGDLAEAEAAAAIAAAEAPDAAVGVACYGVNLVAVRAYQGRVGEMVDMLRQAAEDSPFIPCYRAVLAFALAESGRREEAAVELAHFGVDGFRGVSHDTNRFLTLAMLAEVVVQLDLADEATQLWPLLEPYSGRHVVLNCYGGGGTVWGPATAHLAGLARLLGQPDRAQLLAGRARVECDAIGDRSFVARLGVGAP